MATLNNPEEAQALSNQVMPYTCRHCGIPAETRRQLSQHIAMRHKTMMDKELIDIFEYHFGIDLTQPKYDEARYELAEFFSKTGARIINEWHDKNAPDAQLEGSDGK